MKKCKCTRFNSCPEHQAENECLSEPPSALDQIEYITAGCRPKIEPPSILDYIKVITANEALMDGKKVYCKNCKYIQHVVNHEPILGAGFYGCQISKYTPFTPWEDCAIKNKDGKCKDYKRKWWKLW